MQKSIQKGFTLIELLVVIAIIGILAAIVLVSLGSARSKGADASIQGNLSTVRTQMELVSSGGSYASACTDVTVTAALGSARTSSGVSAAVNTTLATVGTIATVTCHGDTTGWAAEAPMKSNTAWMWCVDSTGKAATTTAFLTASDVTCN
jgi:prepilin-type N-terminal cleavage/methylation domain-containing protein